MSLVVINYLNIFGVAVAEAEDQPPWSIDCHRPLALTVTDQRMEADRFERRNIVERPRGLQNFQPRHRFGDIHTAELRFAVAGETFGRPVGETHNHWGCVA